ncbi:MAG: hypothetical protein ACK5NK_03770 [Niabella sp.]
MKHYVLIILALLAFTHSKAQDTLFTKKSGTKLVKVKEVTDRLVKYNLFDNPDGAMFSTAIGYVDSIIFEGGTVERFARTTARPPHPKIKKTDKKTIDNIPSNIVTGGVYTFGSDVNISYLNEPVNNKIKNPFVVAAFIQYQRLFLNKRVGIAVAPFIGFNQKAYGGTASAIFYIKRFGKFNIGVGPEYMLTAQNILEHYYISNNNWQYVSRKYFTTASAMSFTTRMYANINTQFCINADAGIGGLIGSSKRNSGIPSSWSAANSGTFALFKLGVGYRF